VGFYTFKLRKKSNSNFFSKEFFFYFVIFFVLWIFELILFLNVFFIFYLISCIYFLIFSTKFDCCNFNSCNIHKLYFFTFLFYNPIRALGRPLQQDKDNMLWEHGLLLLHHSTFSLMSNFNEWNLLMMKQHFMQQSRASKEDQNIWCVIYWGRAKNVGATNLSINITNKLESLIWLLLHHDLFHPILSRVEEW
jgi:hypothetical protein